MNAKTQTEIKARLYDIQEETLELTRKRSTYLSELNAETVKLKAELVALLDSKKAK